MHTHPLLVNEGVGGPCRDAPEGSVYAHPSRTRQFSVYKLLNPSKVSKEPRPGVGVFCLKWTVNNAATAGEKPSLSFFCVEGQGPDFCVSANGCLLKATGKPSRQQRKIS